MLERLQEKLESSQEEKQALKTHHYQVNLLIVRKKIQNCQSYLL